MELLATGYNMYLNSMPAPLAESAGGWNCLVQRPGGDS